MEYSPMIFLSGFIVGWLITIAVIAHNDRQEKKLDRESDAELATMRLKNAVDNILYDTQKIRSVLEGATVHNPAMVVKEKRK